jgi:hypothetical protein
MANEPTFNPNAFRDFTTPPRRNRAVRIYTSRVPPQSGDGVGRIEER